MDYRKAMSLLNEEEWTPQRTVKSYENALRGFRQVYKQLDPESRKNKKSKNYDDIVKAAAQVKEMIEGLEKALEDAREKAGLSKKPTIGERLKKIFNPLSEEVRFTRTTDRKKAADLKALITRLRNAYRESRFDNPALAKKIQKQIQTAQRKLTELQEQ